MSLPGLESSNRFVGFFFIFGFGFGFFETGFLCVALAILELTPLDQAGLELRNPPASASQVLGAPPLPS